jgi:hypothetical protein
MTGADTLLDHDRIFAAPTPTVGLVAGFALAWLVMVVAMMLPVAALEVSRGTCLRRGRELAVCLPSAWPAILVRGNCSEYFCLPATAFSIVSSRIRAGCSATSS